MARGETLIVAGIGWRRGCDAAAMITVVERAAGLSGRRPDALAAPSFKRDDAQVQAAADRLDVAMVWVEQGALAAAQSQCVTRSMRVADAVGVASVAEGCALAAAGAGAELVLARIDRGGVTCAVAEARAR